MSETHRDINSLCIDCNTPITNGSKRCQKCHLVNLGKLKKKHHFCIDCGIEISKRPNAKRCKPCNGILLKEKYKGINNPMFGKKGNWKGGLPNCIDCGKQLSIRGLIRCRPCAMKQLIGIKRPDVSKRMSGKSNPRFGKLAPSTKRIWYKDICFRSGWEAAYAKYLDHNNIKWEYEKNTFALGECTYTPDFYLPEKDEYIEIKGWWRKAALIKFNKFINLYNKKITVLMKTDLKKLNLI